MKSLFAELRSRLGSNLKGVLPKWHGPFQARFTHSVIPSEVEESLILTITSSKRCLDCARHDKKPIWATRLLDLDLFISSISKSPRCYTAKSCFSAKIYEVKTTNVHYCTRRRRTVALPRGRKQK